MNIGITGAGNLASGLTKLLIKKGHAVMLSFSKELGKLRRAAQSLGLRGGTPAEAAEFGDMVPPFAELLPSPSTLIGGVWPSVFICESDAGARKTVAGMAEDIGAAPVDAGALNLTRYPEPTGMLLVQRAYMQSIGARIGLTPTVAIPDAAGETRQ